MTPIWLPLRFQYLCGVSVLKYNQSAPLIDLQIHFIVKRINLFAEMEIRTKWQFLSVRGKITWWLCLLSAASCEEWEADAISSLRRIFVRRWIKAGRNIGKQHINLWPAWNAVNTHKRCYWYQIQKPESSVRATGPLMNEKHIIGPFVSRLSHIHSPAEDIHACATTNTHLWTQTLTDVGGDFIWPDSRLNEDHFLRTRRAKHLPWAFTPPTKHMVSKVTGALEGWASSQVQRWDAV